MNTPKIRFKGFKDAWEQRKLGEIYGSIGNAFVGTATPYYVNQGHFYLESNNVKDGQINHNSEIFINDEFYEKQKDKWLHAGDMVMVQSGHVGHAAVIPKELDNTAAHALIMFRNAKEKIEPYFLNYEYQTDKTKKKIENITTGNTIKHILASDMQEFEVDIPKYEEQKIIAGYFRTIDHLITLHQRKCDETKQLKKFMLQKMFPKNGEKNPKIRFEGFTDDWEQRKLGALMEDGIILEQSDGNHGELYPRSEEFVNEGIPYIAASSISSDGERIDFNLTKYLSMERAIQFRKGVAKNGDVLLAHNATVGPSVMLSMDYEFAILSTSLTLYRLDKEKMSPMFFLQAIRSGYFQKQLEVFMKQTTRSQVPILTQRNLQISYPINKVEQERIGEFLSNLDHLITLHQRKCEKLKALKKFMLQNMFI